MDSNNAILVVQSGAGGQEAQEWAALLRDMYLNWAKRDGVKAEVTEQTTNDIGGVIRCHIWLSATGIGKRLESERGVHRLVRISPYDEQKRRHTSFALVELQPLPSAQEQVRSYVTHPYELVIDHNSGRKNDDVFGVLAGIKLGEFLAEVA